MKGLLLALTISAQPLVSEHVLEPSVRNEVDHALARAPIVEEAKVKLPSDALSTNVVVDVKAPIVQSTDIFGTNSLSATQIAIKLVSTQRSDGRWFIGTNDVTKVAVEILRSL